MKPPDEWREAKLTRAARVGLEPGIRCWHREAFDGTLRVLYGLSPAEAGDSPRWHLSIAHTGLGGPDSSRYPTWDEVHEARYKFLPGNITVAMLLPPKSQYVNVHQNCFHLWQTDPDGYSVRDRKGTS